jgi:V/A-type H+/Na+-transporting ATPase subunit D
MERVSPTRAALLAKRAQIELAEQGRDLLTEKRNALLKELQKLAQEVVIASDVLEAAAAEARMVLHETEALEGPEAVRSAALASRGETQVEARLVNVMGAQVPEFRVETVSRGLLQRGYALTSTSPRVDAVAQQFEGLLDLILSITAMEVRLRFLAREIRTTTRRVNALDSVLLPRLRAERDYVYMMLEEREREVVFRFKRLQHLRQAAHRSATASGMDGS